MSEPPDQDSLEEEEPASHKDYKPLQGAPTINLSGTKYDVVETASKMLGLHIVKDESSSDFDITWTDSPGSMEKYIELKSYQRINHFPGMGEIARKDSMARNVLKMKKYFAEDYDFLPGSWVLPAGMPALRTAMITNLSKKRRKTYILKPPNSSQGQGIYLLQSPDDLPKDVPAVVQEYIDRPMLIDGFKFDLRLYVLITSCAPLKMFLYRDGLVRLSTKPYHPPSSDNLHQSFMHLTNYSINKFSDTFTKEADIDKGSKRTMKWFNQWLTEHGHNQLELRDRIADVVVKTMLSVHPHVVHSYQTCRPGLTAGDDTHSFFEILGFDIILDHTLKPWLLEVNRSPSFNTDSQLDFDVKTGVILSALKLINLKRLDRQGYQKQQRSKAKQRLLASAHQRGYSGGWYLPSGLEAPQYEHRASRVDSVKLYDLHKKMEEVKRRLEEIRWKHSQDDHEIANMGDYVCIYPPSDPLKARHYSRLLKESSQLSRAGAFSLRRKSGSATLLKMKECELMELLSQYEAAMCRQTFTDRTYTDCYGGVCPAASLSSIECDIAHITMTREIEEEKTQRVMVALGDDVPHIQNRLSSEVQVALKEVGEGWKFHQPSLGVFWFDKANKALQREILQEVFDHTHGLMMTHWGRQNLSTYRLYRVLKKLKSFLLSKGGQGLWSAMCAASSSWEKGFKEKTEVLSMSEFECCRRVVRICRNSLIAHYFFLEVQAVRKSARKSRQASSVRGPLTWQTSTDDVSTSNQGTLPRIPNLRVTPYGD